MENNEIKAPGLFRDHKTPSQVFEQRVWQAFEQVQTAARNLNPSGPMFEDEVYAILCDLTDDIGRIAENYWSDVYVRQGNEAHNTLMKGLFQTLEWASSKQENHE